jgi:hypothetical protein
MDDLIATGPDHKVRAADVQRLFDAAERAAPPNLSLGAEQRPLLASEATRVVDMVDNYRTTEQEYQLKGWGPIFKLTHPKLEEVYEWRVELSCGCVHQKWTRGDGPAAVEFLLTSSDDYLTQLPGEPALPAGQHMCFGDSCARPRRRPVRDIVEWIQRGETYTTETFAGEEVERVRWDVVLSCGHLKPSITEVNWKPEDGFTPKGRGKRSLGEWEEELDQMGDHPDFLELMRRNLAENFPEPAPFTNCDACEYARHIVAYQLVGPLVPPPKPPPKPRKKKSPEERLRERIRRSERELRQARKELKQITTRSARSVVVGSDGVEPMKAQITGAALKTA